MAFYFDLSVENLHHSPQGVMDGLQLQVKFVWQFIHCFGEQRPPGGMVGPSYSQGVGTLFFRVRSTSFHFQSFLLAFFLCLPSSSIFLSHLNLNVTVRKCSGERSCASFTFSIVVPNGTSFFALLGSTFVWLGSAINLNTIIMIKITSFKYVIKFFLVEFIFLTLNKENFVAQKNNCMKS